MYWILNCGILSVHVLYNGLGVQVVYTGARSNFLGGCQGRRTGVGVTTVPNSLTLGGWVTKVLKNGDEKLGEGGLKGG